MTKPDKDMGGISALLEDAADFDQTTEEAAKELVSEGVDVAQFLVRVQQAIDKSLSIAPIT